MKKFLSLLIAASVFILAFQLTFAQGDQAPVRIASLKGPTTMGLVKMMEDHADDSSYAFTVAGTADEIVPLLVKGELDIAFVPANLASVLYNKIEGGVQVAAINTLGVLYVVEVGDTVHSPEDLKGKTLYSTGKGTTPEYALNTVLEKNGIDPAKDLTIEFKAESTEVASALGAGQVTLAMLPQPYVTAVQAQNPDLRIALSLTDEWAKALPDSALVTGVVLIRGDFIQNNPESVSSFLNEYRQSVAYTNENPTEASVLIEKAGIAKAPIAQKAIPLCNIVCIEGAEMARKVSGYLSALYQQDAASVGGSLPNEDFYYTEN